MQSLKGAEQRTTAAAVVLGMGASANLGDDLLQGAEEIAEFLFVIARGRVRSFICQAKQNRRIGRRSSSLAAGRFVPAG